MPEHELPAPVIRRVRVPLGGLTVAELRAQAETAELDPDAPEVRAVLSLQQPERPRSVLVTLEVGATGAAGAVAVAVELKSETGQPITPAAWRSVKVAAVVEEARQSISWLAAIPRKARRPSEVPERTGRRGRPPTYSELHYVRVADVYRAALGEGQQPLRAVARAFCGEYPGLGSSGDNRPKAWAAAARARGYLTDTATEASS